MVPHREILFLGSGLKGADDLYFHTHGIFSSSFSIPPQTQISAFRPKSQLLGPTPISQLQGLNLSLEAQIPALRPKPQPRSLNSSLKAQIPVWYTKSQPRGIDPNPIVQISAS